MENKGYTGRKLNNYIWIPKSKTDLREFREIIKICHTLQQRDGYFSDITLGQEMVSLRAIVDRDNTADSYIEKYQGKSIGNQSYTSNARMMLRILRWLGLATKDYNPEKTGRFYLTPHGLKFLNFSGAFPARTNTFDEAVLYEEYFAKMRFHSVNDDIRYRNYHFRQRVFYNLIKTLSHLTFASHYELAMSALVLKNDSNDEFNEKIGKIMECREGGKNIRWLMNEYGLDCDNKSTLTGIYDGPKVLLSFAKQLGLAEEIIVNHRDREGKEIIDMYARMYSKSGHISPKSIKKCTKITPKGVEFVNKYQNGTPIWFDKIAIPKEENSAIALVCQKNDYVETEKIIETLNLDENLFYIEKGKIFLKNKIEFDLYRDVPYENRKKVIEIINNMDTSFFDNAEDAALQEEVLYLPKGVPSKRCIECSFRSCGIYNEKINAFGGRDRFASRVCPENILTYNDKGELSIDSETCAGCGLCALNCSFDGIIYDEKFIFRKAKNAKDEIVTLEKDFKKQKTEEILENFKVEEYKIKLEDVPELLKSFLKKINLPERKWDKDKCYTYVRNVFKLFGVEAIYSGSGGMKTRSDVTIEAPFVAVSEVKSPAESPINMKAVRQAFDASVQMQTKLTMAIGLETHSGAKEQELKYRKATGTGILLLEIQYLSFLVFVKEYFIFTPDSLKYLIENYKGHFMKESLIDFLLKQKSTLTEAQIKTLVESSFSV